MSAAERPVPLKRVTAANVLTLTRGALSPVVFWLIAIKADWAALAVFLVAMATDAVDGIVARRLNEASDLGRRLDPLVDKVLMIGTWVFLLAREGSGLSATMVTVLVLRELLIQSLRDNLEGAKHKFGASWPGKLKTTVQSAAVVAILLSLALRNAAWLPPTRDAIVWAALVLTVCSALDYLRSAWEIIKKRDKRRDQGEDF